MDIASKLASLSAAERNLLFTKLKQQKFGDAQPEESWQRKGRASRVFDPSRDGNFKLTNPGGGGIEDLAYLRVPRTAPRPGQVEVEIGAAALNFRDALILLGEYPTQAPELGSDCAGTVVAVGEGVDEFTVGDEVIAVTDSSSFSRFAVASTSDLVKKPSILRVEEAAAIPTVFLTVYYGLHHLAHLASGERILIHSAAGGVGLAAIQYAQWVGAEIYATVSSEAKRQYLQSIGVEKVFNSRSLAWVSEILEDTRGEGVDVVLNSLSGEAIPQGLSVLRKLGRFIELGRRDFAQNSQIGLTPFDNGLSFFAVSLSHVSTLRPALSKAMFQQIIHLYEQGVFYPLPVTTYPGSEISSAFQDILRGTHIGKFVVQYTDQKISIVE